LNGGKEWKNKMAFQQNITNGSQKPPRYPLTSKVLLYGTHHELKHPK
jgi:hypothetical protein